MTEATEARSPAQTAAEKIRELLLSQPDLKSLPVATPEWPELDGQIYVRSLTAAERSHFEMSMDFDPHGNPRKTDNIQTRLAVLAMVTAEGDRIFEEDDVNALARKSASALQKVFTAAAELNGLSDESTKALAKN